MTAHRKLSGIKVHVEANRVKYAKDYMLEKFTVSEMARFLTSSQIRIEMDLLRGKKQNYLEHFSRR